jgi:predicted O-linked N-acetylglucosamine transferase (SPINDLY family)
VCSSDLALAARCAAARAFRLAPEDARAANTLGVAWQQSGRRDPAFVAYRIAAVLDPALETAWINLANILVAQGEPAAARSGFRRALAIVPDHPVANDNLLFTLNYLDDLTPDERLLAACTWAARRARPMTPMIRRLRNPVNPDRQLRIGYLSADLYDHPVVYNLGHLLRLYDRDRFQIYAYAEVERLDHASALIQRDITGWRSTIGVGDGTVAEMIRVDGIDILVALAGHTGMNRIRVLGARPAPVQVSYGDLTTSGMEGVDYWLTDPILHPPDTTERFVEELVRLPVFEVHLPPDGAREPGPPPSLARGHVTFGSFNNLAKLTPAVTALWARVLHAVPNSRLVLKYMGELDAPEAAARFRRRFVQHGIAPERLDLVGGAVARAALFDRIDGLDVALDPFPFNGCTTTFEALWMGVPVVTRRGDRFVGRVGEGMLTRLGLDDLVADDAEGYVRIAAALAADVERRAMLRATLRARLTASPLCDPIAHIRAVEAAYRTMWRRWCAHASA